MQLFKPHFIAVTLAVTTVTFTAYSEIIFLLHKNQLLYKILLTAVQLLQLFQYAENKVTVLIVALVIKVDFFSKDIIFISVDHTKEL